MSTGPSDQSGSLAPRPKRTVVAVRWAAAIVFVAFGAAKFVNHASELASFRHYALPAPGVFVYIIGVIEIAGGLLLARGVLIRVAAPTLAIDMVGAIVFSGLARGEDVSLTLAPLLLVAVLFLLRSEVRGLSRERSLTAPLAAARGSADT